MMGGKVYVMEPADYERWLAGRGRRSESLADAGRSGCSASTAAAAATARTPTVHGPAAGRGLRQAGADLRTARTSSSSRPTSATSATRSCCPSRRSSPAIEPIMPSYEGQISEDDLLEAHRLHQVASGTGRRTSR